MRHCEDSGTTSLSLKGRREGQRGWIIYNQEGRAVLSRTVSASHLSIYSADARNHGDGIVDRPSRRARAVLEDCSKICFLQCHVQLLACLSMIFTC